MKETIKLLLSEDSYDHGFQIFRNEFQKITGMSMGTFIDISTRIITDNEKEVQHRTEKYILKYRADDPYYKLYEIK